MENQTRFDLNAAIEKWRQELTAYANLTAEVRRELETHLRDSIAGFQQRGLNNEESFWLARRRVGQPQQLGEEFVKADPAKVWRERVFWICLAVFLLGFLENIISSLTQALMPVRGGSFLDGLMLSEILSVLRILIPLIIIVLLGLGKMVWQLSKLKLFIESRLRLAITAFVLIAISATFDVVVSTMHNAKINYLASAIPIDHKYLVPIWSTLVEPTCYRLIILLLLVWFLPPQNQKLSVQIK